MTCWDVLENDMEQPIEEPKVKRLKESPVPYQKERLTRVGRPPGRKNGQVSNRVPGRIQCHLCENTFDSTAQARAHLLIHSGIKPFKCTQCEYRSYSRFNVTNNHWSNKHDRKGDVNDVETNETEKENMKAFVLRESEKMSPTNGNEKDEEPKRKEKVENVESIRKRQK